MLRRRRGFTLIELLVVIAIIGILAAMLFPVFARARESARKIQCLSNVKNIALAVQMYLTDYDRFPPKHEDANLRPWLDENNSSGSARCNTGNSGDRFDGINPFLRWPVLLDEYIKNREVWRCPSIQHTTYASWIVPNYTPVWWWYLQEHTDAWGPGQSCSEPEPFCLGPCVRAWPSGWGGTVTDSIVQMTTGEYGGPGAFVQTIGAASVTLKGRSTSEIDDPAQWIVCGDNNAGDGQLRTMFSMAYASTCCWGLEEEADCCAFNTDPSYRKKYAPHLGGLNLGFADGHAKWWDAEGAIAQAGSCHQEDGEVIWDIPVGNIKGTCPTYEVIN